MTFDNGTNAGAVMWNICFPLRGDRAEDDLGVEVFLADLKPRGGLYCFGVREGCEGLDHSLAFLIN